MADSIYRDDCPAPLARRLAAGVGGRTALSRTAVGSVGPARLAGQSRNTAGQHGRGLGRAVVAARTMGGRNDPRLALWRTNVAEKSWLHADRRPHAGAWHRREHGDLR